MGKISSKLVIMRKNIDITPKYCHAQLLYHYIDIVIDISISQC